MKILHKNLGRFENFANVWVQFIVLLQNSKQLIFTVYILHTF